MERSAIFRISNPSADLHFIPAYAPPLCQTSSLLLPLPLFSVLPSDSRGTCFCVHNIRASTRNLFRVLGITGHTLKHKWCNILWWAGRICVPSSDLHGVGMKDVYCFHLREG